jgi:hypothetical protein
VDEDEDIRHPPIRPDYGKPTKRVFSDAIRYLISKPESNKGRGGFDALGLVEGEMGDEKDAENKLTNPPIEGKKLSNEELEEPFSSKVPRWDEYSPCEDLSLVDFHQI